MRLFRRRKIALTRTALLFGAAMGFIGGLLPAVKAARMAPIDAMRGT